MRSWTSIAMLLLACCSGLKAGNIDFSGSGTSGTINPGSLPWRLISDDATGTGLNCSPPTVNRCGISVWGMPGLGSFSQNWPAATDPALSLTITFTGLAPGVTIDQAADPARTGFDDFTRFHEIGDSIVWTPSYTGGNSVTFTAPKGFELDSGDDFFVNVAFTGGMISTASFTGSWSTRSSSAVPEPGTLLLAAAAVAMVAVFRVRGFILR
ncbi:MAG TPA: hypothetical protein VKU19_38760 [Bryobacteraceae bacterium]|nr:hypothetical protein [Bryobacteraceae bacterium]